MRQDGKALRGNILTARPCALVFQEYPDQHTCQNSLDSKNKMFTSAQSKSADTYSRVAASDDVESRPVERGVHRDPFCARTHCHRLRLRIKLRVVELCEGDMDSRCGGEPFVRSVSSALDCERCPSRADGLQLRGH